MSAAELQAKKDRCMATFPQDRAALVTELGALRQEIAVIRVTIEEAGKQNISPSEDIKGRLAGLVVREEEIVDALWPPADPEILEEEPPDPL